MMLQGKVLNIRYPKADDDALKRQTSQKIFYVLELETPAGRTTAKGDLLFRPTQGDRLKLTGDWTVWNGQKSFKFTRADVDMPVNERDMLAYACEITKGFGPTLEQAIWDAKGEKWREVDCDDVRRLTPALLTKFRDTIDRLELTSAQAQAVAWLMGHGATSALAAAAWGRWQQDIYGVCQANCYALCDLPNYGFASVDRDIRVKFGIADDDSRRIKAAILYCMGLLTERGATAINWYDLSAELTQKLPGVGQQTISDEVAGMFGADLIGFQAEQAISLASHYKAEYDIIKYALQEQEEVSHAS